MLAALFCIGCTHGAANRQAATPPDAAEEAPQACGSGTGITDLGAELHDGDWGHGSIIVRAWIPKPIRSLYAVVDYATTDGQNVHIEDGIIDHEARTSCGGVELVGFDIDGFLHIDKGSVTLTDIVYEDGTTEPGPLEVPFEMTRIEE